MLRRASFAVAMLLAVPSLQAALVFNDLTTISIDFSSFTGAGFAAGGGAGRLDSDEWKTLGMSDGNGTFGGTHTSGDFARGQHSGGASTGGFYAWDVNGNGSVLAAGWQPTADDVTPGNLVLWLRNGTGSTVDWFDVSFDRWVRNDQDRSSSFDFGSQTTEPTAGSDTGSIVDSLDTGEPSDANGWQSTSSGTIRLSQSLADGEDVYLIWSTDDVGGSGSRDEFGISNLSITPVHVPEPGTLGLLGLSLSMAAFLRQRRKT